MSMIETLGYFLITFSAGHDTTKNALAGGLHALAEHPEEFEKLKHNPELVATAVEEIVRWASPVNYSLWMYHCGPQWAKRLQLTGDLVTGSDAEKIGLVMNAAASRRAVRRWARRRGRARGTQRSRPGGAGQRVSA